MNQAPSAQISHTPRNICQLSEARPWSIEDIRSLKRALTSSSRFVFCCAVANSLMFPCGIHSLIMVSGLSVMVSPTSDSTFGCFRVFQSIASVQNFCNRRSALPKGVAARQKELTLITPCAIRRGARKTLTSSLRPPYSRFETFVKPSRDCASRFAFPGGLKRRDLGRILWPEHVLYNNFTHFLRTRGSRSRLTSA